MTLNDFLEIEIFTIASESITVSMLTLPITLVVSALLFNTLLVRFIMRPYFNRIELNTVQRVKIRRLLAAVLLFLALWLSVEILLPEITVSPNKKDELWRWQSGLKLLQTGFAVLSIFYGFQLIIWLINDVILKRYFVKKEVDLGRQYTITRLILYVGSIFGLFSILKASGQDLSLLLGGGAALLVGIGLGLQQTFNDLISGVIILIEGTVEVGDIVKVDDMVAKMRKIGLRVSEVETRDSSVLLIPNSKLVVDNVNNWSHYDKPTRFQVTVGVSYTSDVRLVERLLLRAANDHSKVLKNPAPRVQFIEFGNSSLDFMLHFYSRERMAIEFVKSDIRFNIINLFRDDNIEIPFPQTDLWLRNAEVLQPKKGKKKNKIEEKQPVETPEAKVIRKETDLEEVKKDMPREEAAKKRSKPLPLDDMEKEN